MKEFGGNITTVEYLGKKFDARFGGPFDRGSADSWYSRGIDPHYYEGDTMASKRFGILEMTKRQVAEYLAGYQYNEEFGGKKDYS
jgi:hypothetical protein